MDSTAENSVSTTAKEIIQEYTDSATPYVRSLQLIQVCIGRLQHRPLGTPCTPNDADIQAYLSALSHAMSIIAEQSVNAERACRKAQNDVEKLELRLSALSKKLRHVQTDFEYHNHFTENLRRQLRGLRYRNAHQPPASAEDPSFWESHFASVVTASRLAEAFVTLRDLKRKRRRLSTKWDKLCDRMEGRYSDAENLLDAHKRSIEQLRDLDRQKDWLDKAMEGDTTNSNPDPTQNQFEDVGW